MAEQKLEVNATNAPRIIEKFEKAIKDFAELEIKSIGTTLAPEFADKRESNYCYIKDNQNDYDKAKEILKN
ncbi:unnamed protein product [Rotaria magnacalcarata]|uniref:Uncharacterized protein n=1 Tax=Rotaria magnacalcarata TaxID=392030 RepID=A0A814I7N8_9BILA|nr:unnamed protein product [Rotaria magnacalcarata]CAF2240717.1 unnamed protein product [Rotaria magnacalcarata]